MAKRKHQSRPARREKGKAPRRRAAKAVRVGGVNLLLDALVTTCGTVNPVWASPRPVPLTGIFVNLGICSIEVTIAGRAGPVKIMIPSRAGAQGAQMLGHPGATGVTIECLPTVAGGDCTVVFLLIW
jgi:hypothetical protein